jgi:hypothetical protein
MHKTCQSVWRIFISNDNYMEQTPWLESKIGAANEEMLSFFLLVAQMFISVHMSKISPTTYPHTLFLVEYILILFLSLHPSVCVGNFVFISHLSHSCRNYVHLQLITLTVLVNATSNLPSNYAFSSDFFSLICPGRPTSIILRTQFRNTLFVLPLVWEIKFHARARQYINNSSLVLHFNLYVLRCVKMFATNFRMSWIMKNIRRVGHSETKYAFPSSYQTSCTRFVA